MNNFNQEKHNDEDNAIQNLVNIHCGDDLFCRRNLLKKIQPMDVKECTGKNIACLEHKIIIHTLKNRCLKLSSKNTCLQDLDSFRKYENVSKHQQNHAIYDFVKKYRL